MIEDHILLVSQQENFTNETTKQAYRKKVWDQLVKTKVSDFPNPFGRIPNFKGATQAAAKLLELEEFKVSKAVEVNPDKPLEPSRVLVLKTGKDLYVPVPRLQKSLLKKLTTEDGVDIQKVVSRWGIENTGTKIDINDKIHIDLFILGSVAVSKQGYRIGKGKGYADLEYAVLKEMNAIDDNTIIVTTVHDLQVFEMLPQEIFKKHDVPVDYILTPTQIIKTENKPPRPECVYWELLSQRQLSFIEVLRELKKKHEESDPLFTKRKNDNKFVKPPRAFRRTKNLKTEVNANNNNTLSEDNENVAPLRKPKRKRHFHSDFSLLVKNIERNVRVRDLKKALMEKEIKPYSITWKGYKGFCYLHYATKTQKKDDDTREPFAINNVIEILQELKITPDSKKTLLVKVMEPITRIETTDVTAV